MDIQKLKKKGLTLNQMLPAALTVLTTVIGISVGADIVKKIQDQQTVNSAAYNVSAQGLDGLEDFADWFSIIVTVVSAVIVIGLVLMLRGRE